MKPAHNPRTLFLIILIAITAAFLTGTFRLFRTAHAGEAHPLAALQATVTLAAAPAGTPQTVPTKPAFPVSADTNGIIALTVVIVATILAGSAWGMRRSAPAKKTRR